MLLFSHLLSCITILNQLEISPFWGAGTPTPTRGSLPRNHLSAGIGAVPNGLVFLMITASLNLWKMTLFNRKVFYYHGRFAIAVSTKWHPQIHSQPGAANYRNEDHDCFVCACQNPWHWAIHEWSYPQIKSRDLFAAQRSKYIGYHWFTTIHFN